MSTPVVSANAAALSDSIKLTFHLIHRLSKLASPSTSTPPDEHSDVSQELTQDIRESLKQNEEALESIRQETDDLVTTGAAASAAAHRRRDSIKERERARIAAQVARLEEDLKQ